MSEPLQVVLYAIGITSLLSGCYGATGPGETVDAFFRYFFFWPLLFVKWFIKTFVNVCLRGWEPDDI